MPPVPPSGSHQPRFTTLDRAQRVRFRRAVTPDADDLRAPGIGPARLRQPTGGPHRAADLVRAASSLGVAALVASYFWHGVAFWAGTNTMLLQVLRLGLMALAVGWAYLFVDAWRLGQPLTLQRQHRLAIVGVNGFLCFSVAGALLFGAHMVGVQRDFMISMFGDGSAVGAHHGRYNVLLMGGDSGAGRWGLRPDSMTVASIDAETGKTVLISLPRNMQNFPFPEGSVMHEQFPDGFDEEGMYLNGLSTWALDHASLFKGSKNPGVDATIEGVEGITGLKMNYWAMVNLAGLQGPRRRGRRRGAQRAPADPRGPAQRLLLPLHRPRHAHARRRRHAVVRPRALRLRRLLPHGAAEVRDERDARAGQPADGRHATSRRSPRPARRWSPPTSRAARSTASSTWRSRRRARRSRRSRWCRR